jgi:hypothetical protein
MDLAQCLIPMPCGVASPLPTSSARLQFPTRLAEGWNVKGSTQVVAVMHDASLRRRWETGVDFVWNTRRYGLRLALRWLVQGESRRRKTA